MARPPCLAAQVVGAVGFAKRSLPDPTAGDPLLVQLCCACRSYEPAQRPTFTQILEAMDKAWGPNAPTSAAAEAQQAPPAALPPQPQPLALPPARPSSQQRLALPGPAAPEAPGQGSARSALAAAISARVARRHSLDANAGGARLPAPAAQDLSGPPLSVQLPGQHAGESPRSRRRYRSPRGEDAWAGPPAVTARLTDGRKSSPRSVASRPWQNPAVSVFADLSNDQVVPPRPEGAEAERPAPPGRLPSRLSPFAMHSTEAHAAADAAAGSAAASPGGEAVEAAAPAEEGGDAGEGEGAEPMDVSPRRQASGPQAAPAHHLDAGGPATAEQRDGEEGRAHNQAGEVLAGPSGLRGAASEAAGEAHAGWPAPAAPSRPPMTLRQMLAGRVVGRPGHRRVASDEVRGPTRAGASKLGCVGAAGTSRARAAAIAAAYEPLGGLKQLTPRHPEFATTARPNNRCSSGCSGCSY
jgi:hypothetical protein